MVETDSAAMSERAMKILARGGDMAIDTKPPMTRYWAMVKGFGVLIKTFMSYFFFIKPLSL